MTYEEGLAKLEARATLAKGAVWVFVADAVVTGSGQMLEAMGAIDLAVDLNALAAVIALAYIGFGVTLVASVVLVARWIYRAQANLHEAGLDALEFTPGWAVGWYFIPFANLVKPFQAMRELWNASHSEGDRYSSEAPSLVKWWWGAWIIGNILSGVGARIGEAGTDVTSVGNAIGAASTALIIVAAVLLTRLIGAITAAQRSGGVAATVFA